MLHQGILPYHTKWAQFFERLRYVVIGETHAYRGVFGSYMANVIRRLKRICHFYGLSCGPDLHFLGAVSESRLRSELRRRQRRQADPRRQG